MKNIFLLAGLFSSFALIRAAEPPVMPKNVTLESYSGWSDSLVMRGGDCKAVVVPAVGGRVLHYAVNGENIIYENPDSFGKTLVNTPRGFSVGGYQCDIGPELRGIPDHKLMWYGPWRWRAPRDYTAHVLSEPEMTVGIQMEKEFIIDPDSGELGIVQRMHNIVSNDVAFCLWDRTLAKPGGFAMFPLSKKSRFKAGWSIRNGKSGSYSYDGDKPSDRRVRIMDGVLVARAQALPDARELKVGADSEAGWIAYARDKVLFVKFFPTFEKANYSDGGNSVEFYCSDRIAELEPLSPEIKLKPGENYSFPEKWALFEIEKEVTTYEQARALVKRIPKSPFGK